METKNCTINYKFKLITKETNTTTEHGERELVRFCGDGTWKPHLCFCFLINLYRAHIHIMIRSWIIIKCNIKILIKLKWVWTIPDSRWFHEENLGFHSRPAFCHLFLSTSSLFSHEIGTIRILIHSQKRNINHSEKNGFVKFTSVERELETFEINF